MISWTMQSLDVNLCLYVRNHKILNKWNLCCISKNLGTIISNICYKMNKYEILSFDLYLQGLILDLRLSIFTWNLQISFFSLKEKVLVFKVFFSLREKVLIWERERKRPSLGSNSFLLGNDFSYLVGSPKMKGVGVYL